MNSKSWGVFWLGMTLALGAGAAFALPHLVRYVPWSWENRAADWVGSVAREEVCSASINRRSIEAYQKLIARIYPILPEDRTFPVTIRPLHGDTVNAFATLGGQIYVYDGLIQQADTPEELAGVLAHEIEHVRERHILQGAFGRLITSGAASLIFDGGTKFGPQVFSTFLNLRFSTAQEADADEGGLRRLQAAQVDVAGFKSFFEKMNDRSSVPAIVSDHPSDSARILRVQKFLSKPSRPILDDPEWKALRQICMGH